MDQHDLSRYGSQISAKCRKILRKMSGNDFHLIKIQQCTDIWIEKDITIASTYRAKYCTSDIRIYTKKFFMFNRKLVFHRDYYGDIRVFRPGNWLWHIEQLYRRSDTKTERIKKEKNFNSLEFFPIDEDFNWDFYTKNMIDLETYRGPL